MHLRNSRVALRLVLFLFLLNLAAEAQNTAAPQAPPRSSQPAPSQSEAPAPAQETPQGQEPGTEPGGFVFHSDVQEVLLHATVIDDKQRMVTNLDKNAFTVFEDGKPQVIKSFRHEDIPISLGIVPLARSFIADEHDADVHLDGLSEYGLLPDFFQDVANQMKARGAAVHDLSALFRSAETYLRMWERVEALAQHCQV